MIASKRLHLDPRFLGPLCPLTRHVVIFLTFGLAGAAHAQFDTPEIVLYETDRQARVGVAADEVALCPLQAQDPCRDESEVGGPFAGSATAEAFGRDGSYGWADAWQNTDVSDYSIRGKGAVMASARLGGGEEANVTVVPESFATVVFTVTESGPFSLDVVFTAQEAPSTPVPPSGTVQFFGGTSTSCPGGCAHTYTAGGTAEPTFHAEGQVVKGDYLVFGVYVSADRAGEPGQSWNYLGDASASFEFVLSFGDRDGDGLPDEWEENGIDFTGSGIEIDLPAMGADPDHKDLFVELDAMQGVPVDQDALAKVKQAFAEAPADLVDNPGGEPGIALHIVRDGDLIPVADLVGSEVWLESELADIKYDFFGTSALRNHPEREGIDAVRRRIFRYGVWAGQLEVEGAREGGHFFGPDFVLAATAVRADYPGVETRALAGHLMHEVGHTLGLRHGGQDDDEYKPNYLSVMNYAYSQPYLETSPEFVVLNKFWKLDYSRAAMMTLDEGGLYDSHGLDGPSSRYMLYNKAKWDDPDPVVRVPVLANSVPMDWNWNDQLDDPTPSLDLNRRDESVELNHLQVLRSYSDWNQLVYPIKGLQARRLPRGPNGGSGGDLVLAELAAFADVPWEGLETLQNIFSDDFESGSTDRWQSVVSP